MNFAPYQSSPPESTRALSPPPGGRPSSEQPARARSSLEDPWAAARGSALPSPSAFVEREPVYHDEEEGDGAIRRPHPGSAAAGGGDYYVFETGLGIRMDVEACLAYLVVPPLGGVALLLLERKSDYVRFHAWQSTLLFATLLFLHLIFSWSRFLSWVLFLGDLCLVAYLTLHAYRDAETLDRSELPFFGRLASSLVDRD